MCIFAYQWQENVSLYCTCESLEQALSNDDYTVVKMRNNSFLRGCKRGVYDWWISENL